MAEEYDRPAARPSVDDTSRADGAIATATGATGRMARPARWLPALVGIGVAALVWQVVALHNALVLPRIGAVWNAIVTGRSAYWHDTLSTLYEMVVGLGAGFSVAIVLAVAMCHSRFLDRAIMPLAVTLNVTPVVALAPAFALSFGFGYAPKFIVTAIIVFFPFLVNALVGLRSVDPEVLDVFQTLDASRWEILVRLRLPSSLPFLFAAARVCFPLSLVGAVVSEFVTSGFTTGLGSFIATSLQTPGPTSLAAIYGAVAILAAIGLILTFAVSFAEARLLSWQTGGARER